MLPRDEALLWDMLQAARDVRDFAEGRTFDDYCADQMLQAAVERKFEIIGEAARNVSGLFRSAHQEIPWDGIIGQRHRLVHDYQRIDPERVWRLVDEHIPSLIKQLEAVVPPPPPDPEPEV